MAGLVVVGVFREMPPPFVFLPCRAAHLRRVKEAAEERRDRSCDENEHLFKDGRVGHGLFPWCAYRRLYGRARIHRAGAAAACAFNSGASRLTAAGMA
jgi:hypothetical protein